MNARAVNFRLVYDGIGPIKWSGGTNDFGLQDKAGNLSTGLVIDKDQRAFTFSLQVKSDQFGAPVFSGPFCHGSPKDRFIYLSWRNAQGGFDQRLKLPLVGITWTDIQMALSHQAIIVGVLCDHHPKLTSTGENIGGTRSITWQTNRIENT